MGKRLYVGNLSSGTTEEGLMQAFAAWAPASVTLPMHSRGRQSGYGFIEIPDDEQAVLAIEGMHGKELEGRELTVNEARPRVERNGGSRRIETG